jgi:hypothetical protein
MYLLVVSVISRLYHFLSDLTSDYHLTDFRQRGQQLLSKTAVTLFCDAASIQLVCGPTTPSGQEPLVSYGHNATHSRGVPALSLSSVSLSGWCQALTLGGKNVHTFWFPT